MHKPFVNVYDIECGTLIDGLTLDVVSLIKQGASPVDPFCYLCFMFVFVILSCLLIPCSLVITCWDRADLLALLCVVFSCLFVTFPYGVPGQLWYLIVFDFPFIML